MNKLFGSLLPFWTLVVSMGCNEAGLTKRVQIANDVSVLMSSDFEKTDLNTGQVLFQSKIGSADLIIAVV